MPVKVALSILLVFSAAAAFCAPPEKGKAVGQDFAFSNMRNHCRNTSWEEKKLVYSSNLEEMQRFERNSISGNRKIIEVEGVLGNKIFTSERLSLYKNYLVREINKKKEVSFINASEGGVLTEIPNLSLREVIKKHIYSREEIDIETIRNIDPIEKNVDLKKMSLFLNSKIKFYKNYKNKVNSVIKDIGGVTKLSDQHFLEIIKKAESIKNSLYAVPQNGDIVEILTREKSKPSRKWLDFVKTTLAKRHIRNSFN